MSPTLRRRVGGLEASTSPAERLVIVSVSEGADPAAALGEHGIDPQRRDLTVTIRKPDQSRPWVRVDGREITALEERK